MHPQYTKKERKYKPMSDTILALLGFATVSYTHLTLPTTPYV